MPEQIGFKRLFLSRAQRFALDISRLGTDFKPNRAERIVKFLEGLSISYVARHLYWYVMPKRKYAPYGDKAFIMEYLPWFNNDKDKNSYTYLQKTPSGKLLVRQEFKNQMEHMMNYAYSWKKAHVIAEEMLYRVQTEQKQRQFNNLLRQQKEAKTERSEAE